MNQRIRQPVSNAEFAARVAVGGALIGGVTFISAYYEPIYLFKDSGVAPITAFLIWPFGFGVGAVFGVVESIRGNSIAKYVFHLSICAVMSAAAIGALFFIG